MLSELMAQICALLKGLMMQRCDVVEHRVSKVWALTAAVRSLSAGRVQWWFPASAAGA